jgi:hypothetical protein
MTSRLLAQIQNPVINDPTYSPGNDPTGQTFTSNLISAVIRTLFLVATIAFVFQFLMGAIQWILSEGDKTKIEKARQQVTYSLIGLVLTFSVSAILYLIGHFLGITSLETFDLQWPTI